MHPLQLPKNAPYGRLPKGTLFVLAAFRAMVRTALFADKARLSVLARVTGEKIPRFTVALACYELWPAASCRFNLHILLLFKPFRDSGELVRVAICCNHWFVRHEHI